MKEQCLDLNLFIVPLMNHYSSNLPDWYALTSPKYKVISKASIAASLVAIYKDCYNIAPDSCADSLSVSQYLSLFSISEAAKQGFELVVFW